MLKKTRQAWLLAPILFCGIWVLIASCAFGNLENPNSNANSNSDSNPGSGNSGLTETGAPVDIPVTIAKVIKPVSPPSILATPVGDHVTFTAETTEPNAVVDLYDKNQALITQVTSNGSGAFTIDIPLATLPYEDPVSFVVRDGEDLSPAVTVRTYSDLTFTVGISRQPLIEAEINNYTILSGYDLAYSDICDGILYNAQHTDLHYALLCTNLEDTETVVVDESLASPLSQMLVSPDHSFLVGINTSNEIIHLNLSTGVETVISDNPVVASHPTIRLSPNGDYVVTTMDPGTLPHHAVIEPTTFTAGTKNSDSTIINEGILFYNIVECDWVGNSRIYCLVQNPNLAPNVQYDMYYFDLTNAFASNDLRPIIDIGNPAGDYVENVGTQPATRNLRVNPNFGVDLGWDGAQFFYEREAEYLYMHDETYNIPIFGISTAPYLTATAVRDTRWEPDGDRINFAIALSDSIYPEETKIFRFDPRVQLDTDAGMPSMSEVAHAGFGTKPMPIGNDITAYLCKDIEDKEQICVLNWNKVN